MPRRRKADPEIPALIAASLDSLEQGFATGFTSLAHEVSWLRQEWGARDSSGQWLDEDTMARYAGRNRADIIRETDLLHGQLTSLREQRDLADQQAAGHAEKASRLGVQLATLTASLDAVLRELLPDEDEAYPPRAHQAMTQLYEVLSSLRKASDEHVARDRS